MAQSDNTPTPEIEGGTPPSPPAAPHSEAAPPAEEENLGSAPAGAGEEEGDHAPSPSPEPTLTPAPKAAPQWKAEKYDKVLAQKRELEEELTRLRAAQDPNAPKLTEADIARKAQELAAQNDFNRRANETAEKGKAAYPDFMEKWGAVREQVDLNDQAEVQRFVSTVAAIMETGEDSHRIMYELGSNPDLAAELMKLSPVQQGIRLAKMAAKKPDPEPSNAPKPITPVGGRGASQEEINPTDANRADKLSTRTWMERRQADIDAKRKAGVRIW